MSWKFMLSPGLYVVATPIGNLEDMTYRAVRVLAEADRIAAEDTRHSRILLDHYGIKTPMVAFHEHNETQKSFRLIEDIHQGAAIALISDAGTPLISDPGFKLVRAAAEAGIKVYSVPGPSAVTSALSVGGIASDRFMFEGFLPARRSSRLKHLQALALEQATLVFFESSHRIKASVADMCEALGSGREAALCRELTKKFETVNRGTLGALCELLETDADQRRGEFVVLVAGNEEADSALDGLELAMALREFIPASQAARVAARITNGSRREIYQALEDC